MHAIDREENAVREAIDALLEAGLICVFPCSDGVEVRGYGRKIKIEAGRERHQPLDRHMAVRYVERIAKEYAEKIEDRRHKEAMEKYNRDRELLVESTHD